MVKRVNFEKLFEAAKTAEVQLVSASGSGKYTISVVNSNGNGKRITLSKALVEKLDLDGSVSMLPLQGEGVLMVAKELPFASASTIELTSSDGRIAYHAGAVKLLVDTFNLDYSGGKTSMSFNDVEFTEHNGETVAIVTIPASAMVSGTATEAV